MSASSGVSDEYEEGEEEFEDTTIGSSILEDESSGEFAEMDNDDENLSNCESGTKVTINLIAPHKNEVNLEETVSLCLINNNESMEEESNYDTEEEKSETLNEVLNSSNDDCKSLYNNSDNNKENKNEPRQVFPKYSITNTGNNEYTSNLQNVKNLTSNYKKSNDSLNVNINKLEDNNGEEHENFEEVDEEEVDNEEESECVPNSISTAIFNYIRWSKISKIDEYDFVFQKNSDEEEELEEETEEEMEEETEEELEEEMEEEETEEELEEESLSPSFKEKIEQKTNNNSINDKIYDFTIAVEPVINDVKPVKDKKMNDNILKVYPQRCNKVVDEVTLKNLSKETVNDQIDVGHCKNNFDISYTFSPFSSNEILNEDENDNIRDTFNDFNNLRNSLEIENEILYEMLFRWLMKKIKKLKQIEGEVDINYFKKLFGENMKDVQKDYPVAYAKLYTICMDKVRSAIANEEY